MFLLQNSSDKAKALSLGPLAQVCEALRKQQIANPSQGFEIISLKTGQKIFDSANPALFENLAKNLTLL